MKNQLLIIFVVLCGTVTIAQVPQLERDALMALYNSTNGQNWVNNTNWGSGESVSTWHGITVENIGGTDHVKSLDLSYNNLVGSIPNEIGNLTELEFLAFWNNTLTGNIPDELGNCTKIELLSLEDNALTGTIPASFSNLTNMSSFWLNGNLLSGDISTVFSSWTNLVYFSIGDGNFSGNYNQFTGDLDLSNNPLLAMVLFDHNNISTLNIKNGNNANISSIEATDNINLTCVFVDDKNNIPPNWNIDSNATFVETQAECDALSISEFNETSFSIYPNPASKFLNIETNSELTIDKLSIINIAGQKIKVDNSSSTIDISNLSPGLYFLQIETDKGTMTKKFIKE
ncbi:T9SS type A sorting domain-containing protein [Aequorivita capsosiphonis]|uniref:T9SS type A sorting domain-containing protein n=1 Tax=Aequorivita capsosiphonis TaxID=487317 RepID=UPI0004210034|nr:T9SS type A sorting domain-containing protein [Aequorivita capsosiphonis]